MKGLIIKDAILTSKLWKSMLIILALECLFFYQNMDAFAVIFTGIFLSSFCSSFTEAELSKVYSKATFALPFTRKQYILEKYFYSSIPGIAAAFLVALIAMLIRHTSILNMLESVLAAAFVVIVYVSIRIPTQIRFAGISYLIQMILAALIMVAAVYFQDAIFPFRFSIEWPIVFAVALTAALLAGSMMLSLRWISSLEF